MCKNLCKENKHLKNHSTLTHTRKNTHASITFVIIPTKSLFSVCAHLSTLCNFPIHFKSIFVLLLHLWSSTMMMMNINLQKNLWVKTSIQFNNFFAAPSSPPNVCFSKNFSYYTQKPNISMSILSHIISTQHETNEIDK